MYKQVKKSDGSLSETVVLRTTDNAFVPIQDLASTDYQEYLAWLAEGNTPLPADEENT
jgi:hypothetical protein